MSLLRMRQRQRPRQTWPNFRLSSSRPQQSLPKSELSGRMP